MRTEFNTRLDNKAANLQELQKEMNIRGEEKTLHFSQKNVTNVPEGAEAGTEFGEVDTGGSREEQDVLKESSESA